MTVVRPIATMHQHVLRRIGFAYAAFVLYGSLMPWTFRWLSIEVALTDYLGLSHGMDLGFSVRDFVTNISLFSILALLLSASSIGSPRPGRFWARGIGIVAACSVFSASIEFAQLFVEQRSSSAYDWIANTLGAAVGALIWAEFGQRLFTAINGFISTNTYRTTITAVTRRAVVAASAPYLLCVAAANHWFSGPWLSWQEANARAHEVSLLPFYYYQEASTWVALTSMFWQMLLYAPFGAGLGVVFASTPLRKPPRTLAVSVIGACIAAVMETGRLFIAGQHPSLGNILVGALAVAVGFLTWPSVYRLVNPPRGRDVTPDPLKSMAKSTKKRSASLLLARALSLVLVGISAGVLYRFPIWHGPLTVAIGLYAIALSRWPNLWLWVLPAALPVIDLAPLSGWFFVDELDVAVMVTLAVALWRRPASDSRPRADHLGICLWAAFGGSLAISAVIGLVPLQMPDANAFANYYSHYNALRIAKGFVWAFALAGMLRYADPEPVASARRLGGGIVLGLIGATILALWERYAYPGLFDFARGHRIGAFFSSMHNGGSHIEAYLVMAAPFLLTAIHLSKSIILRVVGAALFVAVTYVLMVTFARAGYVAFGFSVMLTMGLLLRTTGHKRSRRFPVLPIVGLAMATGIAAIVVTGSFARHRLASSEVDAGVRLAHWQEALHIMDPGPMTQLFGMGLGRFPETYYFRNRDDEAPATFLYQTVAGRSHLTLGSGNTLYVEQIVDVRPKRTYDISLDLRGNGGSAKLNVLLCERTYFYSYGCESATFEAPPGNVGWNHQNAKIQSHALGAGPWWSRRAVKLSLENQTRGTTIDVRNLALTSASTSNLVKNGNFAQGSDHWFFSSNFNHLPWHIKNLWVAQFFEQGWAGIVTLALLLTYALNALARSAWRGNPYAGAALTSCAGFLVVGLFDSLFDAPRLTMLLFLILGVVGWSARRANTTDLGIDRVANPRSHIPSRHDMGTSDTAPDNKSSEAARSIATRIGVRLGVAVSALALSIFAITHVPGIPYNLRALLNPFHPMIAPMAMAVFFFWSMGAPVLLAQWLESDRRALLLFPVVLIVYAALAWTTIRQATLPAMIHKIAGSPTLGWPWEWETLLRFGALQGVIGLLLTGSCITLLAAKRTTNMRALWGWLFWTVLLLPMLHYVIVERAATDNLTELMANGGDLMASLMLASWCLLIGATGAMVADSCTARAGRRWLRLSFAVLSVPVGYVLLQSGLESNVQKYGASFSALQFLLSATRQDYASGWDLAIRYFLLHAGATALIAAAQWPWRPLRSETPARS